MNHFPQLSVIVLSALLQVLIVCPGWAQADQTPIRISESQVPGEFTFQFTGDMPTDAWTLLWDLGDGQVSEEVRPSYRYHRPGRYEVRLFIWDADGHGRHLETEVEVPELSAALNWN